GPARQRPGERGNSPRRHRGPLAVDHVPRQHQPGHVPMTGRGQLPARGPGRERPRTRSGRAHYDVEGVAPGPAGSAAAIGIALSGWRVLLADKATFPRDKVCGDFLSPRSLTALAQLGCWDAVRLAQPHSVRRSVVHLNGEPISAGAMPEVAGLPGYGVVIPRM